MWLLLALACRDAPPITASIDVAPDGALTCSARPTDPEAKEISPDFTWDDGSEGPTLSAERAAKQQVWLCTATVGRGRRASTAQASWSADGPAAGMYSFVQIGTVPSPGDLAALPDGRLLIATLGRHVYLFNPSSGETEGDLELEGGEYSLTSLALDPQFGDGDHDWLYVWRDTGLTRHRLSLQPFALGEQQAVFQPDCEGEDLECSGDLLFWSGEGETLLYLTTGQGPDTDHQDPSSLGSKLIALRIDEDSGLGEPAFDDQPVVAIGLRNPWRLADCGVGICIADPGDDAVEEIDLYTGPGQNFGWPLQEGPGDGTFTDPIVSWEDEDTRWVEDDTQGPGLPRFKHAPSLGVRVSDQAYGGRLAGWVLFGDFFAGWLRGLELSGEDPGRSVALSHQPYLAAMVESRGTLYAVDLAGGIYRLSHWEDRPHVEVERLSDTHFDDATPYEVRYPLWSNGAAKERAIWLPRGKAINTRPERWAFPDGTELFKTFYVAGQPVETRMITRKNGAWLGTVYVWDGDDATRYSGRREQVSTAEGPWTLPSEASCTDCHDATRGRGWPLGLEPFVLGNDGIDALGALLDPPVDSAPEVEGSALDQAARGYLHSNCAMCHNPRGAADRSGGPTFNLSYDAELDLVGQVANFWNVNHDEPHTERIVVPEDPEASVLTRVMESAEMPYLSVWTPDEESIALLHDWIAELPAE